MTAIAATIAASAPTAVARRRQWVDLRVRCEWASALRALGRRSVSRRIDLIVARCESRESARAGWGPGGDGTLDLIT
jgi:hypothetical protein